MMTPQATPEVAHDEARPAELDADAQAVQQAQDWVRNLVQMPVGSRQFERSLEEFRALGRPETNEFMKLSQRVLGQAMADHGGSAAEQQVGTKLAELRDELDKINPAKAFGMLHNVPIVGRWFASKPRPEYVKDFEVAHHRIESITMDLYGGQDGLRRDSILLDQQQGHINGLTGKLNRATLIVQAADQEMVRQIADMARTDPARAAALEKDGLFYIRQKGQDLVTQIAVNSQAEMVYGILRDNNRQLVNEVDRTTQTAVAALQVGVTAKVALNHQKEVLDKTRAVNKAVGAVVTHTAEQMQSEVSNIINSDDFDAEALKGKLQAVYACLDEADERKAEALERLGTAIKALQPGPPAPPAT
jgi:uncharacterized protein YaaN involved in tellurite resistance